PGGQCRDPPVVVRSPGERTGFLGTHRLKDGGLVPLLRVPPGVDRAVRGPPARDGRIGHLDEGPDIVIDPIDVHPSGQRVPPAGAGVRGQGGRGRRTSLSTARNRASISCWISKSGRSGRSSGPHGSGKWSSPVAFFSPRPFATSRMGVEDLR